MAQSQLRTAANRLVIDIGDIRLACIAVCMLINILKIIGAIPLGIVIENCTMNQIIPYRNKGYIADIIFFLCFYNGCRVLFLLRFLLAAFP